MKLIVSAVTVYNVLTMGYCQGELLSQAVLTKETSTSRTFVCVCSDAASCTADKWEDLLAECRQKLENIDHETTSEKAQETTTPAEETTTPTTTGPVYRGCYQDDKDRVLPYEYMANTTLTIDMCRIHCTQNGYSFLGLAVGVQCFCGNMIKSGYKKVPDNECNYRCTGDNTRMCGGYWRISIYQVI